MTSVRAGMTPMEAIVATTSDAARVVGLGDQIGLIGAGQQADIVIVGGDPLTDIAAMEHVTFVIKQGEIAFSSAGTLENWGPVAQPDHRAICTRS